MFHWFKRKPTENRRYLFGHDVTNYHYLGFTRLTMHEDGNISKTLEAAYVYMFCGKKDFTERMYVLSESQRDFSNHAWMLEVMAPWMMNEQSLSYPVLDKPSTFLMDYMLDTYGALWVNNGKEKWLFNRTTKKDPVPEVKKEEDNVVRISFPPVKKDVDTEKTI